MFTSMVAMTHLLFEFFFHVGEVQGKFRRQTTTYQDVIKFMYETHDTISYA